MAVNSISRTRSASVAPHEINPSGSNRDLVRVICGLVLKIIKQGNPSFDRRQQREYTAFYNHLQKTFFCSRTCWILSLIFLDRLQEQTCLTPENGFKLCGISLLLATKYMDDKHYKNTYYLKALNQSMPNQKQLSLEELNKMEVDFLFSLRFELYVDERTMTYYQTKLEKKARKQRQLYQLASAERAAKNAAVQLAYRGGVQSMPIQRYQSRSMSQSHCFYPSQSIQRQTAQCFDMHLLVQQSALHYPSLTIVQNQQWCPTLAGGFQRTF